MWRKGCSSVDDDSLQAALRCHGMFVGVLSFDIRPNRTLNPTLKIMVLGVK